MYNRISASLLLLLFSTSAFAIKTDPSAATLNGETPAILQDAGIVEKLGNQVVVDELKFMNEDGVVVPLSTYFRKGKPVVLNLVYYECPGLCNLVLNGQVKTLRELDWTPGNQFEIVTVSIDHREDAKLAANKKLSYLKDYGRPEAAPGWHFLTGDEQSIRALANQVGFGFKWDEKEKQYAHGAAIFALTPEGRVSRLLYGIEYKVQDFRLALLEASDGKIGTVIDRIIMFCFRYNPTTRGYSLYLTNLMKGISGLTVLVMSTYLFIFWNRQRRLVKDLKESTSHV